MPTRPPVHRPAGWKPWKEVQRDYDKARPNATARGYDSAWRALRAKFLQACPTCCEPGCRAAATQVDHVLSVSERPDLRLAWDNLRPYCRSHHSARTARDQGLGRAKRDG